MVSHVQYVCQVSLVSVATGYGSVGWSVGGLTLSLLMLYIYGAPSNARNANVVYRVSQEECTKLRESVPYVTLYRYNPKHLYPKLNGYGDKGH